MRPGLTGFQGTGATVLRKIRDLNMGQHRSKGSLLEEAGWKKNPRGRSRILLMLAGGMKAEFLMESGRHASPASQLPSAPLPRLIPCPHD